MALIRSARSRLMPEWTGTRRQVVLWEELGMPSWMALLKDPEKRAIVSFVGTGGVVLMSGVWAAVTFYVDHREKSEETTAISLMRSQNERILELERELRAQKAQVDDFKVHLPPSEAATDPARLGRMQELRRQLAPADPQIDAVLADPYGGLNKLDADIAAQAQRVQTLQNSNLPSSEVDAETMTLKRMIDKRSQMFDILRSITDQYNETAKNIIQSIGR
jgi:hypothetical protein